MERVRAERVRAFRGLRYDPTAAGEREGDLSKLLCSPYDVIGPRQRQEFLDRSTNNAVRFEQPEDHVLGHEWAAKTLKDWRSRGILVQDSKPTFTVVEERFQHKGLERVRRSIWVAFELTEWGQGGNIYPHENTYPQAKKDRYDLLEALLVNTSPILGMIIDPDGYIQEGIDKIYSGQPSAQASYNGEDIAIYTVQPPEHFYRFYDELQTNPVVVADGHHRYETALQFFKDVRSKQVRLPNPKAAAYVMMSLIPLDSPGLVIEPTHRVATVLPETYHNLLRKIEDSHELTLQETLNPNSWEENLAGEEGEGVFCLVKRSEYGERAYTARPKNPRQFLEALKERFPNHHDSYYLFDVVTAAYFIEQDGVNWEPERDPAEVARAVHDNSLALGFMGRPPKPQQVFDLAVAGERAPQKTTYFDPKLPTGIVMRPVLLPFYESL